MMLTNKDLAWHDSYKIGIKSIDLQHEKLFEIVNKLYDIKEEDNQKELLRTILYEFSDYMRTHFADEEKYMNSIGYNDLENHKIIHKDIIESLSKVIHTPAKLSIIQTKMRVLSKRVLLEHIIHEDTKIRLHLIQNNITNDDATQEEIFDLTDIES